MRNIRDVFFDKSLSQELAIEPAIEPAMAREQIMTISEDLSQIRLRKVLNSGLPCYEKIASPQTQSTEMSAKSFRLNKKASKKEASKYKSPFFLYNGTYIRKTTDYISCKKTINFQTTVCCEYVRNNQVTFFPTLVE